MTDARLQIRVLQTIAEIAADDWNACAAGADPRALSTAEPHLQPKDQQPDSLDSISRFPDNPFISHEFLSALEDAACVGGHSGWQPNHLVAETPDGTIAGVAPAYLKTHSRGEYVFDQGWADAFERAGGRYYPKLQVAVPFTPVTGPRLLARAGPRAAEVRLGLAQALATIARQNGLSSAHITFLTEAEWRVLGKHGFLLRTDRQFHFDNAGYASFEDFLSALTSRKRKAIRHERKEALADGITIHRLSGAELTEAVWDAFFAFYMETGSRKWGRPYLTREFFSLIGERMAERILLVMARRDGRWIAGAINFIGADTLYGRNWGAIEHHPFLHFEVCYYQAIDYAIARGLRRVEAGAQGEHKLARGYLPSATYSAHYIAHPGLRRAIDDYLRHERAYIEAAGEELAAAAPFRKDLLQNEDETG